MLHLPSGASAGAALVLHGFGGHPEQPHIVETCEALAGAGAAALRFAYRDNQPPRMTLASALADAIAAVRLLRAHPAVRGERLAVVGFSFGGAVAALLAGRDRRVRAAVLAAAPAAFGDGNPSALDAVARTRARVLLIRGSDDTEVPLSNIERYAEALRRARVGHQLVTIEGGDHDFGPAGPRAKMTESVAAWVRESL